ncbi:MAG TPA: NupC/NupG family nucleoside CNT transporter [Longimicrobiales bacterium]|nr:NupC/NupG family nucleoside CNT transporter [Longimicrobiales bacterium]
MAALMSLVGVAGLLLLAYLISANRRAIRFRTVAGAFLVQAGLGALVLYFPPGQRLLLAISQGVQQVINAAQAGMDFLFAGLAGSPGEAAGLGFVFAFRVLPLIIFFSSLIAVLYYLRVMPWVIKILGGALQKALGTSRTESLSATANVFVGQTEAPLVVRPFIPRMTESELFAVMVGGLASVAGSVLAGYAALGVELRFLIAASFMAAPGGLLMAKMMIPEVARPEESLDDVLAEDPDKPVNVIDAAASGASSGLYLALNVGAMLLAFIALIALMNLVLGVAGGWVGVEGLSMEGILGWVFAPLAFIIGVPWEEAVMAGGLIGQKLVLNEFVAYVNFVTVVESLSARSQAIITFALCGFANFSSIAILIGGLGGMAPSRRGDIARLGLRAVAAGSLANLMSAALAGLFLGLG